MTAIRRPGAASAAVLVGLSAALVAAHLVAPEWSRRAGLDVWNLSAANDDLRGATERRAEVLADAEHSACRRETANQIAARAAAGDLALSAAVDQMREVFRDDRGMAVTLEDLYRAVPTERLRFARHTIERVKRLLRDDPGRCAAAVARLEDEYRALVASPDPAAHRVE